MARNFFAPVEITERLDRIDVAGWITSSLKQPDTVHAIIRSSPQLLRPVLEVLGTARLRAFSRELIRRGIESIAAAPLAGRVIAVLVARGQHTVIYDFGIATAIDFLQGNRKAIRDRAAENKSGWLPGWVDAKLTDAFIDGLADTLDTARAPDHHWRAEYKAYLDRLIARLADDPEIYEWCERIKSDVLDGKLVDDYLAWLTTEIESTLEAALKGEGGELDGVLERALSSFGDWLDGDTRARDGINLWARQLVLNTIVPNRAEIGNFISDVVTQWDERSLVERLEVQIGKDLQFIRINGTLVGGIVGLILFAVTHALG
jgi:uncharacterized membrane-anchored protein YjiN (DUF445 family)